MEAAQQGVTAGHFKAEDDKRERYRQIQINRLIKAAAGPSGLMCGFHSESPESLTQAFSHQKHGDHVELQREAGIRFTQ